MQEDLIGYLLGALEPDEMRRVEAWLLNSEDARRQLAELEEALAGIEQPEELPPPPSDLVSRTLAALPSTPVAPLSVHPADSQSGGVVPMSPAQESGVASDWTWRDWFASITAACIVIAIALPSMLEGRFVARKQACQDNLRELGIAMTQFVTRNAEQRLPSVAPDGYQAFAGMYAPRLREAGLLNQSERTLCPSLKPDEFWPITELNREADHHSNVVTLRQLDEVGHELLAMQPFAAHDAEANLRMIQSIEKLRWMQTTAGGHYAYTLGVRDGEHFSSPRFQGRSAFAVMSDAAILRRETSYQARNAYQSNDAPTPTLISHGGRGINVLYEDGHVGFMPSEALSRIPDHPLFNHDGRVEAGVTLDDASLAPSWQPPFIRASQR